MEIPKAEWQSLKSMPTPQSQEPVHVILLGKRIFTHVIKLSIFRQEFTPGYPGGP